MKTDKRIALCILFSLLSISVVFISCKKNENNVVKKQSEKELPDSIGFQGFETSKEYFVTELKQSVLQETIDEASANGGSTVIIDSGVLLINKPLFLKSNIKLKGLLNKDSTHAVTIKCIASSDIGANGVLVCRGVNNFTIEDLIIDVNNCDAMGIGAIYGASNFLISNNIVKNIGTPKINCVSGEKEILSRQDNPTGINMWEPGKYFTITNNTIMNAAKHGINVNMPHDNPGGHYILSNNIIKNCFMGIDVSSNGRFVEVLNNDISNCIFGVKIVNSHYVRFYNNKIYDMDNAPYYWGGEWGDDSGEPLVLQNNVDQIIIENNILVPYPNRKQIAKWDVPDNAVITITNNSDVIN